MSDCTLWEYDQTGRAILPDWAAQAIDTLIAPCEPPQAPQTSGTDNVPSGPPAGDTRAAGRVLSKSEAKKIARRARRYGYFQGKTDIRLICPRCGVKVQEDYSPTFGTVVAQLDAMMVAHLTDPERCQS